MANKQPVLQFNDATVYRESTKVMDEFTIQVNRFGHTAIVGPNGSGKSTFIQVLTHQIHPLASQNGVPPIRIFGKSNWNVSKLRERVGIVSADMKHEIKYNLKGGRVSGSDVVLTGFFSSTQLFDHHHVTAEMRQRAKDALADMEASYLAGRMFSRMSAGEAQRILIARALVTAPDLLILDEPTTALDFVARKNCLRLIRQLTRKDTTVIIVTHHVEEVIPEIANIILLKEGTAAFQGPKKKILTSENLSTVFGHPLTLHQGNGRYRVELDS
jgi:iron complex transport system ATP-binding protein